MQEGDEVEVHPRFELRYKIQVATKRRTLEDDRHLPSALQDPKNYKSKVTTLVVLATTGIEQLHHTNSIQITTMAEVLNSWSGPNNSKNAMRFMRYRNAIGNQKWRGTARS